MFPRLPVPIFKTLPMSRRNQPYLPLYIQDFMTDEKLMLCSAEATGVYIRIMCLMHKSDDYGKILLRQNFRQTERQIENFATQLAVFLPYSKEIILRSLNELLSEKVLTIDNDLLVQKRMVKDNELSVTRALSGKKGAEKTNNKHKDFASAKITANSENEIDIENESDNVNKKDKKFDFKKSLVAYGFSEEDVTEWLAIRLKKKAINSERAYKQFIEQVEKTKADKQKIMKLILDKQWKGYESTWYEEPKQTEPTTQITRNFE